MFNQYVLILVWIGLMAMLQPSFYREEYNELTREWDWRVKPLFAFVVMVPVIWMAANRGWFADTGLYISTYRNMPSAFAAIPTYMETITKDRGFYALSAVLRVLLGYDYSPYLAVLAIIQAVSVIILFRKYSVNYIWSIFFFIASADYISWMFNGIRQFMAVSILIFGTAFMLKKKWFPLIIIVLIASTMHQSALIMLPFIIIAQGKPWNKKTLLFMAGIVLAMAFVSRFTGMMDDVLQRTQYAAMVSDYTEWQDDGTHPLRVLVYSAPAILAFVYRKQIEEYDEPVISFCINMSIISAALYFLSMVTSGIFIGRLPIYASLYSYILLPWELEYLFGSNRKLVKIMAVVFYLVYYYYVMHFQNGLL